MLTPGKHMPNTEFVDGLGSSVQNWFKDSDLRKKMILFRNIDPWNSKLLCEDFWKLGKQLWHVELWAFRKISKKIPDLLMKPWCRNPQGFPLPHNVSVRETKLTQVGRSSIRLFVQLLEGLFEWSIVTYTVGISSQKTRMAELVPFHELR